MTPDEVRKLLFRREPSERSLSTTIGPSQLGGCRRSVWHKLNATPITNPGTLSMAANLGTAWHTWIETNLADDDRFLLEVKRERDGIRGTVDCFDLERGMVIDWKTIKMSGIPYFPDKQKRWQVQVYGWLLSTEYEVQSVCLVGFPRDGTERDIVTHVEPYDESLALEAIAWLSEIKAMEHEPKPERRRKFCKDYCGYYDPTGVIGCTGI